MSSNPFMSGMSQMPSPRGLDDLFISRAGGGFKKGQTRALKRSNILVIEDDEELTNSFQVIAKDLSWPILAAKNSSEALAHISRNNFDALILDWNLPDFNADALIKLADELIQHHCQNYNYELMSKIPVITHSSEKAKTLDLSWSKHFEHITHWQKPMSYDVLKEHCEKLLFKTQEQIIKGA